MLNAAGAKARQTQLCYEPFKLYFDCIRHVHPMGDYKQVPVGDGHTVRAVAYLLPNHEPSLFFLGCKLSTRDKPWPKKGVMAYAVSLSPLMKGVVDPTFYDGIPGEVKRRCPRSSSRRQTRKAGTRSRCAAHSR